MEKVLDADEFHNQVIKKLDDLCERITRMEERLQSHLGISKAKGKITREVLLIVIAVISAGAAIAQAFL